MQLGIKFAESDCRHVLPNPHLFWLLLDPSCYYHIPYCSYTLSSPPHIKTKKLEGKTKNKGRDCYKKHVGMEEEDTYWRS